AGADEAGNEIAAGPQRGRGIGAVEGVNIHLVGNVVLLTQLDQLFLEGAAVRAGGVLGADGDAELIGLLAFTGGAHVYAKQFFGGGGDAGAGAVPHFFEVAEKEIGGVRQLDFFGDDGLDDSQHNGHA